MKLKALLAIGIVPLTCLQFALADDPSAGQESIVARCTQEGVGKGYSGKDLEDFVAECAKARQSGSEDDPVIRAAMSGC